MNDPSMVSREMHQDEKAHDTRKKIDALIKYVGDQKNDDRKRMD